MKWKRNCKEGTNNRGQNTAQKDKNWTILFRTCESCTETVIAKVMWHIFAGQYRVLNNTVFLTACFVYCPCYRFEVCCLEELTWMRKKISIIHADFSVLGTTCSYHLIICLTISKEILAVKSYVLLGFVWQSFELFSFGN